MRRDVVTQVILEYEDGAENFATRFEAERFIAANLPELPRRALLEDMQGNPRAVYEVVVDAVGNVELIDPA
ncbi:MAG: hypothetical protein RR101_00730 [Burkholderiaceae bacterium]